MTESSSRYLCAAARYLRPAAHLACGVAACLAVRATAQAPQRIDSVYSAQIRALTPVDPRWKFSTELVDHLPYSATVPTPLKVLGYVPGTLGRLSRTADLNKYFRALAAASPRVKVFSGGMSDEGREMLVVAIADEATIGKLDDYRNKMSRLADPRGLDSATRAQLVHQAKPIYWLTGTIHAPETGSPEMLMELAYRLAVDEGDYVKDIRANVITLITPATEVDGRDRVVDTYGESQRLGLGPQGVPLLYWGKYIAHDNNRDAIVLSQKLTQNVMATFLHWKPTVVHDLHESVPFLYTSTGTGPYNDEYDPIVIDEWHTLAYQEITELTRRGLPGVWTHGFYDGWAPNYTVLSIGNLHNSIGRFYETYTSSGAGCTTVNLPAADTTRRWDRPNPPVNGIKWCIRSNINYQQSGVLIALKYVADNRDVFLNNFVTKSERMIARGRNGAPYAFVIPRSQRHSAEAADLVNLFRAHGAEVQEATADFTVTADSAARRDTTARDAGARGTSARSRTRAVTVPVHAGDWIVRLDQPYAAPVRTLLAIQKYSADDPPPYDDTGWTLDLLRGVETIKVADSAVFTRPMRLMTSDATIAGTTSGNGPSLIVPHTGDWRSAMLPWKVGAAKVLVADSAFTADGTNYPAGTFFIQKDDAKVRDALHALGVNAVATTAAPPAKQHAIALPRIALMHTWIETQNEGWVRFAFEKMGVPFTYISTQTLKKPNALDHFDVIVFPHVNGPTTTVINGRPMIGPAIPWKTTPLTPNIGKLDETDDIRPGMGLDGAAALRRFVERGGLLITEGNSTRLPIDIGFTTTASIASTPKLSARGGIYRATIADRTSPIVYGYEANTLPVYFSQSPVLAVAKRDTLERNEGIDPAIIAMRERMRARAVVSFVRNASDLLVSGLLVNGDELAGKAAVVDAPLGEGHVVMFGIRPLWRWETQGTFAMPLNAMANWNHLTPR
ncbi:MAG: M14 family zinc carboxypeptidase [Gemmatimonadaceae bacterium]